MTQLAAVTEDKFSALVVENDRDIVIQLKGNADVVAKQHLPRLLGTVHEHAQQLKMPEVRVDIRELTFMNSSCFKDFICWLEKVREAAAAHRYRIIFQSSAAQHWQRRSLHALSCFARELITIEAT